MDQINVLTSEESKIRQILIDKMKQPDPPKNLQTLLNYHLVHSTGSNVLDREFELLFKTLELTRVPGECFETIVDSIIPIVMAIRNVNRCGIVLPTTSKHDIAVLIDLVSTAWSIIPLFFSTTNHHSLIDPEELCKTWTEETLKNKEIDKLITCKSLIKIMNKPDVPKNLRELFDNCLFNSLCTNYTNTGSSVLNKQFELLTDLLKNTTITREGFDIVVEEIVHIAMEIQHINYCGIKFPITSQYDLDTMISLVTRLNKHIRSFLETDYFRSSEPNHFTPPEYLNFDIEKIFNTLNAVSSPVISSEPDVIDLRDDMYKEVSIKVETISDLLDSLVIPQSLSEEVYVMKTCAKDVMSLMEKFIELSEEARKQHIDNVYQTLDIIHQKIINFQGHINEYKEHDFSVALMFINQKYNRI